MSKMNRKRERVAGLHFFNPVPVMKLVEVVSGLETSEATFQTLSAFCTQMGKTPVKTKVSAQAGDRCKHPKLVQSHSFPTVYRTNSILWPA